MKTFFQFIILATVALGLAACGKNGQFAYTGRMDVDETVTISAQAADVIESLPVKEGDTIRKGETLGRINGDRLTVQRQQEQAQLTEFGARKGAAEAQIQQAEAQLAFTRDTLDKTDKVVADGGATQQRRNELATELRAGEDNLASLQASVKAIAAQEEELRASMRASDIAIRDAHIVSPLDGVVLNKFHFQGDLATIGTPLLEAADLSVMTVKIYVPLDRLGAVVLGKEAMVTVDGVQKSIEGTVSWVASEAEFTPKTILTEETRTTLVYGVKVRVSNPDGILKIGMPVEVRF
jgi:HlyD family secretion protein